MKITAAIVSITSLLSICLTHPVSALRNTERISEDDVQQQRQVVVVTEEEELVECYVTEMSGITPPDKPDLPPQLTCSSINTEIETIYRCHGNTAEFFSGTDLSGGHVKLIVPRSAISGNIIKFTGNTMDDMDFELDQAEQQRKLLFTSSFGQKQVVVIRVSDDSSYSGSVRQSAWQLWSDVFDDENNAKEVYRGCSNGRVNLVPSPSYPNGIYEVNAPWNICSKHWLDAWNDLGINVYGLSNVDYVMVVMPDCLDWDNAAGWGQTPGRVTWYPSQYASLPVTQVHELGHNFGHRHSGKGGISYADDTGYMGNTALWTDAGSKMCFNPAKTWWFGWFSDHHKTVRVSSSSHTGTLIAASHEYAVGSSDIVIRIIAEGTGNKDLYVMYNGASGANSGVIGSRNQILITEQRSQSDESSWVAGLSANQSWSKSWEYGKTLVIKNCAIEWSATPRATIVIAHSGDSALNCQSPSDNDNNVANPPISSPDVVSSGFVPNKFYDTFLATDSGIIKETPVVTKMTTVCADIPDWYDSDGEDCDQYSIGNSEANCNHGHKHSNLGHSSSTACCICGGGEQVQVEQAVVTVEEECHDEHGWYDSDEMDCAWYEAYGSRCMNLGDRYENFGMTANEACCHCR